jgi:Bacteriophage tail sheath protein
VDGVQLGAPGVYSAAASPSRELLGARMDVCAFVGVAPRGPARVPFTDEDLLESDLGPDLALAVLDTNAVDPLRPRKRSVAVPVESWDDYVRLFGRFEGPGRLPYAVAAFFEQGGRRASVVRVVHDDAMPATVTWRAAKGRLPGFVVDGRKRRLLLRARNEGSWGNKLRARLSFATRPLPLESVAADRIVVSRAGAPAAGTLLRLWLGGGTPELRIAGEAEVQRDPVLPVEHAVLALDPPLAGAAQRAEIVEAALDVDDGDGRSERHEHLALGGAHPRRLAAVLSAESDLLYPGARWVDSDLVPANAFLHDVVAGPFGHGSDGYADLVPDDFFDAGWVLGDEGPASGVHAVLQADQVATVVVPDLYEPAPLPPLDLVLDPPTFAGPFFARCIEPAAGGTQDAQPPALPGLLLDPADPADLDTIVGLQRRLAELADTIRAFVVLLDVPPGLDQRRIARWRTEFDTSYAAAYHPWLDVVRSDGRGNVKARINPSAYAAGIVADRELRFGVPFGPSNEIAMRVVGLADVVSPARHSELHPLGVNVFLRERDGILLTAARTLSLDPSYRQLSVRRLMTMLARTLEQELQWLVFEPNNRSLQADLRHLLGAYLRRLYRTNAFAGATEDEAFFVHCDDRLNNQAVLDAGQLIAEIGVAPAEPLEFLVVRLIHDGDGTLLVQERAR